MLLITPVVNVVDDALPWRTSDLETFANYGLMCGLQLDGNAEGGIPCLGPRLANDVFDKAWDILPELDYTRRPILDDVKLTSMCEEMKSYRHEDKKCICHASGCDCAPFP